MTLKRGDGVIIDYPFTDRAGTKVRPALVVQEDGYNTKLNSTVVAFVTKSIQRATHEPSQLLIDIATRDGKLSGLRTTSAVVFTNLYTIHQRHILKTIGSLPATLMLQVDQCLKAALGIK
jgi:mRNA interferase MazF